MRNRRGDPFTACIQARGITGISYSLQARLWVTRNGTATDTAPLDFVECLHATYFVQSPRSCAIIYHGALPTTTRSAALRRYSVLLTPSGYTFFPTRYSAAYNELLRPISFQGLQRGGRHATLSLSFGDLKYLGLHATRIVSRTRFFSPTSRFLSAPTGILLTKSKGTV